MSMSLSGAPAAVFSQAERNDCRHVESVAKPVIRSGVLAFAVWHNLFWLVLANAVGVLLATLLIVPRLNNILGEWTYGRWMSVHINLQLYGWCSLTSRRSLCFILEEDSRHPTLGSCRGFMPAIARENRGTSPRPTATIVSTVCSKIGGKTRIVGYPSHC